MRGEKRPGREMRLKILVFVDAFLARNAYAPSLREIAKAMGVVSWSVIGSHLALLREDGLVEWEPSKPRTLRLTPQGVAFLAHQRVMEASREVVALR